MRKYGDVKKIVEAAYYQVAEHPFFDSLLNQRLPRKTFCNFIKQDSLIVYQSGLGLKDLSRHVFSNATLYHDLNAFSSDMSNWGQGMTMTYLQEPWKKDIATYYVTKAYNHHLSNLKVNEPVFMLARFMACLDIYHQILAPKMRESALNLSHPYHRFLAATYDDRFALHAKKMTHHMRELCEPLHDEQLHHVIAEMLRSAQFEYDFVDQFYQTEKYGRLCLK